MSEHEERPGPPEERAEPGDEGRARPRRVFVAGEGQPPVETPAGVGEGQPPVERPAGVGAAEPTGDAPRDASGEAAEMPHHPADEAAEPAHPLPGLPIPRDEEPPSPGGEAWRREEPRAEPGPWPTPLAAEPPTDGGGGSRPQPAAARPPAVEHEARGATWPGGVQGPPPRPPRAAGPTVSGAAEPPRPAAAAPAWTPTSPDREPSPPFPRPAAPPDRDRAEAPPAAPHREAGPAPPAAAGFDDADDFAGLADDLASRGVEEGERSYAEVVQKVGRYLEQGYDLFALAGYPVTGKTHAVKALVHRLRGFDPSARSEFRRGRAPGQTEYWPFFYAYSGSEGPSWVLMDTSGDLYARIHDNDWRQDTDALGGILRTVGHARGLLLLIHLTSGHLELAATGFADDMEHGEREREQKAQEAQEELDFFDNFLLLARALQVERGKIPDLVRRAAQAPTLDEALRPYRQSPRLAVPVTVLFTQADRLLGADFAVGRGRYLAPQRGLVGVAPFVARHLPTLFDTVRRHARRFRFDFVQSYVERPGPGGGRPVWSVEGEPLSIGLVPALEYLLRRSGPGGGRRGLDRFAVDTRTVLRLHRLLHPRLWEGVEVEL